MALLIHLPPTKAIKLVPRAPPGTVYPSHLPEQPKLTTERPRIGGTKKGAAAAPTAEGMTDLPLHTLITDDCANGLGPTHGNSVIGAARVEVADPDHAVAAGAEVVTARRITAARRPGMREIDRDHPAAGGAREIVASTLAGRCQSLRLMIDGLAFPRRSRYFYLNNGEESRAFSDLF
mmetsp:Transcript_19533/g.56213  ORF Transcript_19533/g.56213 Transcript_19533/m.56213 type:complete len:178 (+) Transcript_19533:323-856(+)